MTSISNGESGASARAKLNQLFGDVAGISAKDVADVAALIADQTLTYVTGQDGSVSEGDYVRTRAEGFSYQVAAEDAEDRHLTTAGGVKLYELAGTSGLSPKAFGALGDSDGVSGSGTSDTASIQRCMTAAGILGAAVVFEQGKIHRTTDTLTLPIGAQIDMNGAQIMYDGPRDRPALVIGSTSSQNRHFFAKRLQVFAATPDWADDGFIGIKLINTDRSIVEVELATGFTHGYMTIGEGGYVSYNKYYYGWLYNNKNQLTITTAGTTGVTYNNECLHFGGEFQLLSSADTWGEANGVLFTWDKVSSYRGQNGHVFYSPSFEMKASSSPDARHPFRFDGAGAFNKVHDARQENCNEFAYLDGVDGAVRNNEFDLKYSESNEVTTSSDANGLVVVNQSSGNKINIGRPFKSERPSWSSGNVTAYLSSSGVNNGVYARGPFHFVNSAGVVSATGVSSAIDVGIDYMELLSGVTALGLYLSTEKQKAFILSTETEATDYGRMQVNCFDAAGARLGGGATVYAWSALPGLSWTGSLGGGYSQNSDSFYDGMIQVHPDVAYVELAWRSGARLKSVSIQMVGASFLGSPSVYSGLASFDQQIATAKPDTSGSNGRYARGQTVFNGNAAIGQPSHWTATNDGWLAKSWVASTACVRGQIRLNGSNVYVCRVAGTSAASGGPTGTGSGIIDGGVTWDYLGPKVVFASSGNLA